MLVFDLDHVRALRELGIVGVLVGTLPKAPQQNVFLGLPLQLSTYEAVWLVEMGHAVLVDGLRYNALLVAGQSIEELNKNGKVELASGVQYAVTSNTTPASEEAHDDVIIDVDDFLSRQTLPPRFSDKYAAFRYLANLHYYMMPGLRFGGVFVCYPGDPLRYHSHLIVKVLAKNEAVDLLELVTSGRLATAVKKAWVLIGEKDELIDDGAPRKAVPALEVHERRMSPLSTHIRASRPMLAFSIEWAGFG